MTERNYGKNPTKNQFLANAMAYEGDFGNGQYQVWLATQDPSAQAIARRLDNSWNGPSLG